MVLHQAHCSTCLAALPSYAAMAAGQAAERVALIELPPHEGLSNSASPVVHGRLSARRDWFASAPVVVLLENGVVRDAAEGKAAVGLRPDWRAMKFVKTGPADRW